MQVGVCSGLVLGFLAAVVAVHFFTNRRAGIPFSPKASGFPGNGVGYYSPPGAYQGLPCSHILSCLKALACSLCTSLGWDGGSFRLGVMACSLLSAQ